MPQRVDEDAIADLKDAIADPSSVINSNIQAPHHASWCLFGMLPSANSHNSAIAKSHDACRRQRVSIISQRSDIVICKSQSCQTTNLGWSWSSNVRDVMQ